MNDHHRARDRARARRRAHAPSRPFLAGLLVGVLALSCSACLGGSDDAPRVSPAVARRSAEQLLLNRRAEAIRNHDRQAFMRTVSKKQPAFVREQRRYFDNLQQLPLSRFTYRVLSGTWPDRMARAGWGPDVSIPRVRLTMQLRGFDSGPVRRTTGIAFSSRHGHLRVVGDRPRHANAFPGSQPAPWDLATIYVRSTGRVLGLFGRDTVSQADEVLDVVDDGIEQVGRAVPFSWAGRVVLYYFDDAAVLNSFQGVPGGNIRHLGAMSFPVRVSGPGSRRASMRITLLPSSVKAGQPFLGRIVRHELTHVVLGARDDGSPVWFAEGLAEYVGARPLPRPQRRIASVALTRARQGVDSMPSSNSFNGSDQDWHYALSWMACDYIASSQGEDRLWDLMRAFHRQSEHAEASADATQDAVLRQVLGYDSHELARRAASRILAIYG